MVEHIDRNIYSSMGTGVNENNTTLSNTKTPTPTQAPTRTFFTRLGTSIARYSGDLAPGDTSH